MSLVLSTGAEPLQQRKSDDVVVAMALLIAGVFVLMFWPALLLGLTMMGLMGEKDEADSSAFTEKQMLGAFAASYVSLLGIALAWMYWVVLPGWALALLLLPYTLGIIFLIICIAILWLISWSIGQANKEEDD